MNTFSACLSTSALYAYRIFPKWFSRVICRAAPAWSAVLLAVLVAAWSAPAAHARLVPITAGVVYGQGGNFNTNNSGVTANGLAYPVAVALDSSGGLYVVDSDNHRVLFFPKGSTTATRVYGQNGSFTSGTENNGGISANSLANPEGVAVDNSGGVYIADYSNSRVLYYPSGSTTASRVYGQGGSFASGTQNNGGVSADSLNLPRAVAVDSSGNLYVADYGNNRVLYYPSGLTTATRVYGQGVSFTTSGGETSANGLDAPWAVALDGNDNLYVADPGNNRVLFYLSGSTTAIRVYGQAGSFASGSPNNGGPLSANSLSFPQGVAVDGSGNLYVADYNNVRVLVYPSGSTTATQVYGQGGSFTTNVGGTSANSMYYPSGVGVDSSGNVYVADSDNNRVLEYGPFGNANVCPSGQSSPAPCNTSVSFSYYAATDTNFGTPQVVTQGIPNLDFTLAGGSTCTGIVSAGTTCIVNATFAPLAPGLRMGAVQLFDNANHLFASTPISGIGQGPAIAFGPGTQTTVPASGLQYPVGVALDGAGDIFIADYVAADVVEVTPGGVQTTVPAAGLGSPVGVAVDGAGDVFIADLDLSHVVEVTPSGVQTSVGSGLGSPIGVAVDGADNVFIADQGNTQVVKVTPTGVQTIVPATGLSTIWGVAVDGAGNVFIADGGTNNRVVEVTPNGVQTIVPATGLNRPYHLAVDAAGDVFIADPQNFRVVEVPAGCISIACQTTVGVGLSYPSGVAVDAAGDVFIGDQGIGEVFEVNRSQPPSLSFQEAYVGLPVTDTTQSFTIQNIGNQPLDAVAPGLVVSDTQDFLQVPGTGTPPDCTSSFALIPGADCNVSITFMPQNLGSLIADVDFTDNALNAIPSALQYVSLSGQSSAAGGPDLTVSGSGSGTISSIPTGINCGIVGGAASGTCTASFPVGQAIILTEVPSSGFAFTSWGGVCSGTSPICNVTLNGSSVVTASFAPSVTNYAVQLTEVGNGTGTVADDQSEISCSDSSGAVSGTCSGSYAGGTTVTLTADRLRRHDLRRLGRRLRELWRRHELHADCEFGAESDGELCCAGIKSGRGAQAYYRRRRLRSGRQVHLLGGQLWRDQRQ